MTTTTCDICLAKVAIPYHVEVKDGEHPHNGSPMYKTADVCSDCLRRLKLRSDVEFEWLRKLAL